MHKILVFLFLIIVASSCNASKNQPQPEYIIGKTSLTNPKYSKDSIQVLTPAVQSYNAKEDVNSCKHRFDFVLQIKELLNKLFPEAPYENLNILVGDYRDMNRLLERKTYSKNKYPNLKIRVSDELITGNKKYSLLVELIGRHGISETNNFEGGVLYILVINNEEKTLELSKKYKYNFSPLNKKKLNTLISSRVKEIILN